MEGRGIKRYLEIGVSTGGLIQFFHDTFAWECFGADLRAPTGIAPGFGKGEGIRLFIGDSQSVNFRLFMNSTVSQADLVWIDADHSYRSIESDYRNALMLLPKLIAFHDICGLRMCDGAAEHWNELKQENPGKTIEFIHDDPNTGCGIGVLIL
ncbi:MAG TPA: hypothetical protein VK797_22870 [Tepidisphaeraceae bacterium]|nr:hypothetical protein [Tepidisphaeraceae bacterium]